MPYASPAPYTGVVKARVFPISTTQDLYTIHLKEPVAAAGAGLLLTIVSKIVGYRFEISDFLAFTNTASPLTAIVGLKAYNQARTQEYGLSQIAVGNFFLENGPPKFSVPVAFGDNLDVTLDGDALSSGDQIYLQFKLTRLYEAGVSK